MGQSKAQQSERLMYLIIGLFLAISAPIHGGISLMLLQGVAGIAIMLLDSPNWRME